MVSKNDYIELSEKKADTTMHMTEEDERKIIPKEYKNLNHLLKNNQHISKYTWEVDGERVRF
jgi:hypothetical protein